MSTQSSRARTRSLAATLGLATLMFAGDWSPAEAVNKTCQKANIRCQNNCRNGETLPIGSSKSAIEKCDVRCLSKYDRCSQIFAPGRSNQQPPKSPPKTGTRAPVSKPGGGVLQQPKGASGPILRAGGKR